MTSATPRGFARRLALLAVLAGLGASPACANHRSLQRRADHSGRANSFQPMLPLSPNTVVWSVNGMAGGNGTWHDQQHRPLPSASGHSGGQRRDHTCHQFSTYPAKSGAVTLTIARCSRALGHHPHAGFPGSFTLTLNGAYFGEGRGLV